MKDILLTLMLCIGVLGFGIVYRGTVWQFFLNAVALAACALSVATLISTIANTQQQAMMGGVLILLPAILLSGNHEKVRQWRRKQALRRTRQRRPDMYEKLDLSSKQDKKLLKEMEAEDLEKLGNSEKMD